MEIRIGLEISQAKYPTPIFPQHGVSISGTSAREIDNTGRNFISMDIKIHRANHLNAASIAVFSEVPLDVPGPPTVYIRWPGEERFVQLKSSYSITSQRTVGLEIGGCPDRLNHQNTARAPCPPKGLCTTGSIGGAANQHS